VGTIGRLIRHRQISVTGTPSLLGETLSRLFSAFRLGGADHPTFAVVASPLAMVAAAAIQEWWTWPLLLGCSFGWSGSERWRCLLAFEEAVVGTLWMSIGVNALRTLPGSLPIVGACWAAFPAALAVVGWWTHRHFGE
jgi:hypothetical protein